jgi:hypothetical protein
MSIEVRNGVVTPRDATLTLSGSAQTLVTANQYRSFLTFQAPAGGLSYSFTNPTVSGTGVFTLSSGAYYPPTGQNGVVTQACYVLGTAAQVVPCLEC